MTTKILGITLIAASLLIYGYANKLSFDAFQTPNQKLQILIEKDILKSLPVKKDKLHHVELKYRSKEAHKLLSKNPVEFETFKDGTIWLEIEILDLPDDKNPGIITQTSVFDLDSKNKISEFGKTYYIKNNKTYINEYK